MNYNEMWSVIGPKAEDIRVVILNSKSIKRDLLSDITDWNFKIKHSVTKRRAKELLKSGIKRREMLKFKSLTLKQFEELNQINIRLSNYEII